MNKKRPAPNHGIVYSTDPNFSLDETGQPSNESISPGAQKMRIRLDTKKRAGKAVTLIEGFAGKEQDLVELGKQLKAFCGTGGSVKAGEIMIQGDQREKVLQWLTKKGYTSCKRI